MVYLKISPLFYNFLLTARFAKKNSIIFGKTQGIWKKLKGLDWKTQRTGSRSLHLVTQKVVKNTACVVYLVLIWTHFKGLDWFAVSKTFSALIPLRFHNRTSYQNFMRIFCHPWMAAKRNLRRQVMNSACQKNLLHHHDFLYLQVHLTVAGCIVTIS